MNDLIAKTSNGHKISSAGAALAILCFFLPWILASCGGQTTSLNGWQLSAGSTTGSGYFAQQVPGKAILFLVLLIAFAVIAIAYLAWRRGHLTQTDGFGPIGLGGLALLILLITFSGAKAQAAQQGIYFEYQYGLWGVVIGYIGTIIGGVLNLREKS